MKVVNCNYDPVKDLHPVDQFGFVDLASALENNAVPSQMAGAETDYNGIENPDSILGKPSDIFEAMHMESAVNNYKPDESKD